MRFHNLRYTYASLLIAPGEHPKYIQSQLGHSSINLLGDYNGLTLKISLRNPDLSVLPLFQISEVFLDNSSAMRTLDKFFGLQANPVEFEFLVTMWA